jgi:uncharacterized protein (DUF2147 family)
MRLAMIAFASVLLLLAAATEAQSPSSAVGRWKTIDDATGKAKSVVEIYQAKDGRLAGKVVEILDLKDGPNPACDECKGANQGKPIKGMLILWGLRPDGAGKWSGGRVLDPENGKDYKAKLELLEGGRKLGMSGCIAFLCRQQVWLRE